MKKKIINIGIAFLFFSIPSMAQASVSATSEFSVIFEAKKGSQTNPPAHPIEPEEPITPNPDDPKPPSTDGLLSIDYVSYIQFGKQKAQGIDQVHNVQLNQVFNSSSELIEVPNFIQITDNRGLNSGWQLFVEQPEPFKNGINELKGTEMRFNNPVLTTKTGNDDLAPTLNQSFQLNPGSGATLVMTASENQGMGTWLSRYGENSNQAKESIQLGIPGNTPKVAGFYSTSLVWTLVDTPN